MNLSQVIDIVIIFAMSIISVFSISIFMLRKGWFPDLYNGLADDKSQTTIVKTSIIDLDLPVSKLGFGLINIKTPFRNNYTDDDLPSYDFGEQLINM